MGAVDEPAKTLQWKALSGEERYRVVEMARKGEVAISELCKTFGVSRQTLYRAMEAADRASAEALEPKKRGRKPRPASEARSTELEASNAGLHKDLEHWKTKYQVARTLLDPVTWREGEKKESSEERPGSDGRSSTRVAAEDGPEW
jgi:transposase-like protein